MQLEHSDLQGLTEHPARFDLFYDLHTYMQYINTREIKRAYRTNDLPKADIKRLLGLMSISDKELQEHHTGSEHWVGFINDIAYQLKWVDYNKKGQYAGYSSYQETFPDNYMRVNQNVYQQYLSHSLQEQVQMLLDSLISQYRDSNNEAMQGSVMGYLDEFSHWGSATGVLPFLRFDQTRQFLLGFLSKLQPNIWYTTASFIQYLKRIYPYFLIPKEPKYTNKSEDGRYCNFHEKKKNEHRELVINPNDADAFERVEGRYIERFLEYIPFLMGFIDIAYDFGRDTAILPQRDTLKAFKINPRMCAFYNQQIAEPKITVQPNFEVSIESEIYPAKTIDEFSQIGKLTAYDTVSQIKLEKSKVISKIAATPDYDLITRLRQLSSKSLPQNVEMDLKEWMNQGDAIVLYENVHLLESDYHYDFISEHAIDKINKNLALVAPKNNLMPHLEKECSVPIEIMHKDDALNCLPSFYKTVFPKVGKEIKQSVARKKVTLTREIMVKINFPSLQEINLIKNDLLLRQCVFDIDEGSYSILIAKNDEPLLKEVLKSISHEYQITIKEAKTA